MIRVLMCCHGNICRSTMSQMVLQDMVNKRGIAELFSIDSRATSTEEIGNPPHRGTVRKLKEVGIPVRRILQSRRSQRERKNQRMRISHLLQPLPAMRMRQGEEILITPVQITVIIALQIILL